MIEAAIFGSTFLSVFALGLQSLNVNQGHYLAAALTSVAISGGHIALYKYMPQAEPLQLLAYFTGAIAGILSSMWFHRRFKAWWSLRRANRQLKEMLRAERIDPNQPGARAVQDLKEYLEADAIGRGLGVPRRPQPWPAPPRIYDADSLRRGAMRCAYWQCPYEASDRSNYCGSHKIGVGTDSH